MKLNEIPGEVIWRELGGNAHHEPLFKCPEEIKRAELIVKNLDGLTNSSAKELLNKVVTSLDHLTVLRG